MLDWQCEGVGMMCWGCSRKHLDDLTEPHLDPMHTRCIRCGVWGDPKPAPLTMRIVLGQPLPTTSPLLRSVEEDSGKLYALGYEGTLRTSPIAWACSEHMYLRRNPGGRELLTLHGPRLDIEERRHSLVRPPKGKAKNKARNKRKRR